MAAMMPDESFLQEEPYKTVTRQAEEIARLRASTEHAADLVEAMLAEKPWCDQPWARMALAIAARAIRRGRHLTEAEKLNNLADAMDEADREHGDDGFAATAEKIRRVAAL